MVERYPLVPSMGISLSLAADGWSIALVLLTGIIIVTGVLASWTVQRRDKEFFVLLLTLVTGVFGVFVSQDLFVFFLFYEIAVLPMYLLIGIWGSSHKVAPAGPFRGAWRWFAVGTREYAAMKLTLMLLVGLGGHPGRHLRALGRRRRPHLRPRGARGDSLPPLDADVGLPAALARLRDAGRRLPVPHLEPGRPRLGAHRGEHAARRAC